MEIIKPQRLCQQLTTDLKERIEQGVYLVGDKLPVERFIADEKNASHTMIREATVMPRVEGHIKVCKGSGIHITSNQSRHYVAPDKNLEFANHDPFGLFQARQPTESSVAEFTITRMTKRDIVKLIETQKKSCNEESFRDSEWNFRLHVQVAPATQNPALAATVEEMWAQHIHSPYWEKSHDHIDLRTADSQRNDHDQVLRALIHRDPHATKLAMWQHLENTRQMLFSGTNNDLKFNTDRCLFTENPVVHLGTAASSAK